MPDEPAAVSPRPDPFSHAWRWSRRLVLAAGVVVVGVFASLHAVQVSVIFPGSSTQGKPESIVRAGPGEQLARLSTPDGEVVALFGPALSAEGRPIADAGSRPALVFFYGNAMCLARARMEFDRFRRLGLNVLVPDYLGFGMSGGEPSELGCCRTGEACLAFLRQHGFPSRRVVVGGWSLGGAVAIDLAFREPVAGLFAFSTFTSLRDMAGTILPIKPPAFLFRHRFESLAKIRTIQRPILLGHGRRDRIVPFTMFGRLVAACSEPPATLVLDEADHNDFLDRGGGRLDRAIVGLVERATRSD